MRIRVSWIGALGALIAAPHLAGAVPCSSFESCTAQPPPAGVGQFSGPVEAMLFVVPKASQQTAITAEEAYFGAAGAAKPWTVETNLARRNASSGTQGIIAHNIAVPAGLWKGVDKSNSQGVADAVAGSTRASALSGRSTADCSSS